jgi:2-phosphosulfolactate phosphatase
MCPELDSLHFPLIGIVHCALSALLLGKLLLANFAFADLDSICGRTPVIHDGKIIFLAAGQSMRIVTSLLPELMVAKSDGSDVAVVVDVLRATSVMTTAFDSGAKQVFTCCEVSEATALADQLASATQHQRPLLCGERSCKPITGFDCGNSPSEYTPRRVRGQTLIMTTTNGTKAIQAASSAKQLIAASFLNLPKIVEFLRGSGLVHLVCSGTDGRITAEDVLLAGAIIDGCMVEYQAKIEDDDSQIAHHLWSSCLPVSASTPWISLKNGNETQLSHVLAKRFSCTLGGRNLRQWGFAEDLHRCAQIGTKSVIGVRSQQNPTAFELLAND